MLIYLCRMVDYPIIDIFIPNGNIFILFILVLWDKVFNDHVLQLKLVCKLIDGIKHIISFSVKFFLCSVENFTNFIVLLVDVLELLCLEVKLLLNTIELVLFLEEVLLF